jgi:conjugative relaxase-like TrwC/TraI family protein
MLTYGRIGNDGADYYKPEDYYLTDKGTWGGRLSDDLTLSGEVKKDDLAKLINGFDKSGEKLTKYAGTDRHRKGIDMTFAPPKTISNAMLVDSRLITAHQETTKEIMKHVEDNFAQARVGFGHLKTDNLSYAMFTHMTNRNAEPHLHTHVVLLNVTKDDQGETRALSNEKIFKNKHNLDILYKNMLAVKVRELGYEIEITDKEHASYELKGHSSDIKDATSTRTAQILEKVEELKQDKKYKDYSDKRLAEIATLSTRKSKSEHDYMTKEDLYESVDSLLREQFSTNLAEYVHGMQNQEREIDNKSLENYFKDAISSIHENRAAFTKEQLYAEIAKLSVGQFSNEEIQLFSERMEKEGNLISLGELTSWVGETQYLTSPEMKAIEQNVLKLAQSMNNQGGLDITSNALKQLIEIRTNEGFTPTDSQVGALEHIIRSDNKLNIIQGDAGVGKTKGVMANLKVLAESAGYDILGLTPTGKAAQELQTGAGINSVTIDKFLMSNPPSESQKSIWIVDEASMLSSKKMETLFERAIGADAHVILTGDVKQYKPVGEGKMFDELQRAGLASFSMTDVVRQKPGTHMHSVVTAFKEAYNNYDLSSLSLAFEQLNQAEAFHNIAHEESRFNSIVQEYLQSVRSGMDTVIITTTNRDKDTFNELIRNEKEATGEIGDSKEIDTLRGKSISEAKAMDSEFYSKNDVIVAERDIHTGDGLITKGSILEITKQPKSGQKLTVQKGDLEFKLDPETHSSSYSIHSKVTKDFGIGEEIVFTKNFGKDIQNGMTATISEIEDNSIKVTKDNGDELNINLMKYKHIDHAYAMSGYKAQGGTYDKMIWNADYEKDLNYNSAYVAITRSVHEASVYTNFRKDSLESMENVKDHTDAAIALLSLRVSSEQEKETTLAKYQNTKDVEQDNSQELENNWEMSHY